VLLGRIDSEFSCGQMLSILVCCECY
jgi:hypothetical protein